MADYKVVDCGDSSWGVVISPDYTVGPFDSEQEAQEFLQDRLKKREQSDG